MATRDIRRQKSVLGNHIVPRAQFLHLLPIENPDETFKISIIAELFHNKLEKSKSPPITPEEWLSAYRKILATNFLQPEETEEFENEHTVQGSKPKVNDPTNFQDRFKKIQKVLETVRMDEKDEEAREDANVTIQSQYDEIGNFARNEFFNRDLIEAEELAYCGLSVNQIQFIFANAKTHNFYVNLLAIHNNEVRILKY